MPYSFIKRSFRYPDNKDWAYLINHLVTPEKMRK